MKCKITVSVVIDSNTATIKQVRDDMLKAALDWTTTNERSSLESKIEEVKS